MRILIVDNNAHHSELAARSLKKEGWTVSVTDGLSTPVEATVNITVLEIYDGENGLEDLAKISSLWLQTACGYCQGSDLNYDGDVGIDDLRIMAERWLSVP